MNQIENEQSCSLDTGKTDRWFWFCLIGFALLLIVFFKNAWVCDDAYINFRSIEQLFSGNGPNWNPNERVQAYTSPLWYGLLAVARVVSPDPFFNAINLSFLLLLLLSFALYRNLSYLSAGAAFFFLAASNAFVDFSSSGLENILAALLACLVVIFSSRALSAKKGETKYENLSILSLSLLPICRHDLITLMAPLGILILVTRFETWQERLKKAVLMLTPLALWSGFSLIYYGALFPNTAYAKILTGIPRIDLAAQGLRYFLVTLQQDPVTVIAIFAAIFMGVRSRSSFAVAISAGLALNMAYIVWVGGDFMRGRFFTTAFVVAIILLVRFLEISEPGFCSKGFCQGAVLLYVVYVALFPFTPMNTGFSYSNFNLDHGIADERGYYFDVCSLYSYLYSKPDEVFPDFEWSHIGRQIALTKVNYLENDFNGMLGYWTGTGTIIIDRLALADPYLARIPIATSTDWRIGHFKRLVPEEYRKSIEAGKNLFPAGKRHDLFELVSQAARERQLFSVNRLIAILRLNLGLY